MQARRDGVKHVISDATIFCIFRRNQSSPFCTCIVFNVSLHFLCKLFFCPHFFSKFHHIPLHASFMFPRLLFSLFVYSFCFQIFSAVVQGCLKCFMNVRCLFICKCTQSCLSLNAFITNVKMSVHLDVCVHPPY